MQDLLFEFLWTATPANETAARDSEGESPVTTGDVKEGAGHTTYLNTEGDTGPPTFVIIESIIAPNSTVTNPSMTSGSNPPITRGGEATAHGPPLSFSTSLPASSVMTGSDAGRLRTTPYWRSGILLSWMMSWLNAWGILSYAMSHH